MRLVEVWLSYRKERGDGVADAAQYLAEQLGKKYSASRIWEWKTGGRPVPDDVAKLMRKEVLPWLLPREGVKSEVQQAKFISILEMLI